MSSLIMVLLGCGMGFTLITADIDVDQWQFWVASLIPGLTYLVGASF